MSKIDSLYGAHAATPFILRAAFSSVDEMIKAFKQGSQYTQVWYDEYCIIDTPNKNDKDNGIIYRRGYDYQNDMGGAIRIGQVVGPSSGTPYFSLNTMDDVTKISQRELAENEYRRFPISKNEDGTFNTAESGDIGKFEFGTNNALIPGKDSNGNFNDKIIYTWCNVRADNADADSWFYVGWEQPYLVEEFAVHDVSPYGTDGVRLVDATTIKRIDDKSHPFYEQWNIGLPHGIKGDAMRNLRVITPTANQKIYPYDALTVNSSTGVATINANHSNYQGFDDDVKNQRQILVFEYYTFDNNIAPNDPYLIYLGDFNIIKNIDVDSTGQITISYTHNDVDKPKQRITWVKNISLSTAEGPNGGKFTVEYNNNDTIQNYTAQLQWIKNIQIADNGDVTYTYVGREPVKTEHQLKWIDDATLDTETGRMVITFNNTAFTNHEYLLQWVKNIKIADNGTITLEYTGGKADQQLSTKIRNIIKADASSDGVVTFTYNTGETTQLLNSTGDTLAPFQLKRIDNVSLATDLTADKHIFVKYNTDSSAVAIGDSINFVKDMVVRPSDWHLLVLFNDPAHRYPDYDSTQQYTWVDGQTLTNLEIKDMNNAKAGIYWRDYGPIKDQAGILIGYHLTQKQINDAGYTSILDYLNTKLPQGLTGDQNELGGMSTKGKVVGYTPNPTTEVPNPGCEFYAFDYQIAENGGQQWFYLGTIADDGSRDVGFADSISNIQTVAAKVNTNGLIFVKDNLAISNDAMPHFWLDSYES